jgi:acyl carrier protein
MSQLDRPALRKLMAEVMQKQDKTLPDDDAADLREIGFRSLDFSELALRVEDELDAELNFEAAELRQIETIGDVLALLEDLQADLAS